MRLAHADEPARLARAFHAVRLPKDYQFSTDVVFIRKGDDDVILSPRPRDWRE
jgi:virulence-associated protein VagC